MQWVTSENIQLYTLQNISEKISQSKIGREQADHLPTLDQWTASVLPYCSTHLRGHKFLPTSQATHHLMCRSAWTGNTRFYLSYLVPPDNKDDSNSSLKVTLSTGVCEWTWGLSGEAGAWGAGVGGAGGGAAGSSLHPKCHRLSHIPLPVRLPWPPRLSVPWPHIHVAL